MNIRNLSYLFPVIGYYALESLILSLFITPIWRFILLPLTNIMITYLQWACIIWIIKVILFDVFKLIFSAGDINNVNDINNADDIVNISNKKPL